MKKTTGSSSVKRLPRPIGGTAQTLSLNQSSVKKQIIDNSDNQSVRSKGSARKGRDGDS